MVCLSGRLWKHSWSDILEELPIKFFSGSHSHGSFTDFGNFTWFYHKGKFCHISPHSSVVSEKAAGRKENKNQWGQGNSQFQYPNFIFFAPVIQLQLLVDYLGFTQFPILFSPKQHWESSKKHGFGFKYVRIYLKSRLWNSHWLWSISFSWLVLSVDVILRHITLACPWAPFFIFVTPHKAVVWIRWSYPTNELEPKPKCYSVQCSYISCPVLWEYCSFHTQYSIRLDWFYFFILKFFQEKCEVTGEKQTCE